MMAVISLRMRARFARERAYKLYPLLYQEVNASPTWGGTLTSSKLVPLTLLVAR